MREWNDAVDRMWTTGHAETLPETDMWDTFLWQHSPTCACTPNILLNACHLSGLVLARYCAVRASTEGHASMCMPDLLMSLGSMASQDRLCLFPRVPVADYSLRQLRDTVQNLQFVWDDTQAVDHPGMRSALDACFQRFGALASTPGNIQVMNDQSSIEDHPCTCPTCVENKFRGAMDHGEKMFQMTRTCIRRFLSAFCMLYRHLYMAQNARGVPDGIPHVDLELKTFHAVAGSDDYSSLSMHWDLFPGAKLNYIHDFAGMYNAVSQIVYYHNPSYQQRRQERSDVEGLSKGSVYEAVHLLPCLMQIYPDIALVYEDDDFDPRRVPYGDGAEFCKDKFAWVVMGRRVYLLLPQSCEWSDGSRIIYHPNLTVMLSLYVHVGQGCTTKRARLV